MGGHVFKHRQDSGKRDGSCPSQGQITAPRETGKYTHVQTAVKSVLWWESSTSSAPRQHDSSKGVPCGSASVPGCLHEADNDTVVLVQAQEQQLARVSPRQGMVGGRHGRKESGRLLRLAVRCTCVHSTFSAL